MKSSSDNNQNFWISYADLMAGLLFIFILLIGAIVIKYVFLQNNLESQSDKLTKEQKVAQIMKNRLITTQDALKAIKILLSEEEEKNRQATSLISQQSQTIQSNTEEIKTVKSALAKTENSLSSEQNRSLDLQTKLNQSVEQITLTKTELAKITEKLLQTTLAHQKLVEDLNITKARIKNLTGIRIKAIQSLKQKLGKNIQIDPNSGAIRLSSSVLFDRGSDKLKPNAKVALKRSVTKYINTLLTDKKLKGYIENIIIEGHTDTDGSFMYNLELSQKRAFAVLDYLYKQRGINKKLLRKYVSASGKSYSNKILKNGKEDKEASRRIEVKFTISNKKAMGEIEDFLKGNYR